MKCMTKSRYLIIFLCFSHLEFDDEYWSISTLSLFLNFEVSLPCIDFVDTEAASG